MRLVPPSVAASQQAGDVPVAELAGATARWAAQHRWCRATWRPPQVTITSSSPAATRPCGRSPGVHGIVIGIHPDVVVAAAGHSGVTLVTQHHDLRVLGRLAAAQPSRTSQPKTWKTIKYNRRKTQAAIMLQLPRRHQPLIKAHVSSSEAVQGYGRP